MREHPAWPLPLVKVLREHGVRVLTVREILAYNVDTNMSARVDLEELASEALKYEMAPGHDVMVGTGQLGRWSQLARAGG